MALVTQQLLERLRHQVEVHGTVVWYDPDGTYEQAAAAIAPEMVAGAAVHHYDPSQGFMSLRSQLEPIWGPAASPPRLLIYVPLARSESDQALIEYEVAGAVLQPGQQPPERNTDLAIIAREALSPVRPAAALEQIVTEVEAGKWTLAELDAQAESWVEDQAGVLSLIFGSGNPTEICLQFLSDETMDAQIDARQALPSLTDLLREATGVPFPQNSSCADVRARLARQVLVTDMAQALDDDLPSALQTFPLAAQPAGREFAASLAVNWRNRRDMAVAYCHWADRVEVEIGMGSLPLNLSALSRSETFCKGEERLQAGIEEALGTHTTADLVTTAQERLDGFWAGQRPEIKTRWQVITAAGRLLLETDRVEMALKGRAWPAAALVTRYAQGEENDAPWCKLDTAQRHLERDFHAMEVEPEGHAALLQMVSRARQRYAAIGDLLAERFTHSHAKSGLELAEIAQQVDIYRQWVAPALKQGKVAYLLVDAFRYEMADNLGKLLPKDWDCEIAPALATAPTITEIGMAALLPGAENGLAVIDGGGGGLAAVINGQPLKSRQDRLTYLAAAIKADGQSLASARLDQLAPLTAPRLGQEIRAADLVLVTATDEIDRLCETNPSAARRQLGDVLDQLRRGVKTLFGLGVKRIIITADHGYLFGEKLSSGQKIDPPGGDTVVLKRRVWLGRGGAKSEALFRAPLAAFGLGGDLELASPWNLSCFKAGGGDAYFHGGLSLQEMVVPVMSVSQAVVRGPSEAGQINWALTLGSPTITTRFLSVTVKGQSSELLPIEPPCVRLEVRTGDAPISTPVSASYGFLEGSKDVQLTLDAESQNTIQENTVTLMLTETPTADQVSVHLLDAATGVSLARLESVPCHIAL
jgi:hypothetical protein